MPFTSETYWSVGDAVDSEYFFGDHKSRDAAIEHGRKQYQGAGFGIIHMRTVDPASFFGDVIGNLLDRLDETSYDTPEVKPGGEEELDELLRTWAVKNVGHCYAEAVDSAEEIPAVEGWVDPDAEFDEAPPADSEDPS